MFIVLKRNIRETEKANILSILEHAGIEFHMDSQQNSSIIKIMPGFQDFPLEKIKILAGVDQVIDLDHSYRLVSRDSKKENTKIYIGDLVIGGNKPVVIAGPCAVENEKQIIETAKLLKSKGIKLLRGGAYKPRTSPYSFTGLEEKGLHLLQTVKEVTGLSIVTEILDTHDVDLVSEYSDILQVGSRNMQNYKLLRAVGRIQKPVLLKRGMSAKLNEFLLSAEYIMSEGNDQIILCERGIRTFVEYSRNTLDLNIVPVIKNISHLPIIVDPSHGTGRREIVEPMSLAALAAGADGIMIEVHPHPEKSWSDPQQALSLEQFSILMDKVNHFIEWRERYANFTSAS